VELEYLSKQFGITTLSDSPLRVVVKVHGFKPKQVKGESSDIDDSTSIKSEYDALVKFTDKYKTKQCVRTHKTIHKYSVKKKVSLKQEKMEADDEKGDFFSIEDLLNSKEFHKTICIKLTSCHPPRGYYCP
jgi:hypothetical protein